jgi:hypothetical protein
MKISILPVLALLATAQAAALADPVEKSSPYTASLEWLFKRGSTPYCCIFANHIQCCE